MHIQRAPKPPLPALRGPPDRRLPLGFPKVLTLVEGDAEEEGGIQHADEGDVDFVKPAGGGDEFEGEEEDDGYDVGGGVVGEEGVGLYAFEGGDGAAELDFSGCVGGDFGKGVGEDGDEDGEEEGVAEEGVDDHEDGAEDLVEVGGLGDAGAVETEPDPEHPFGDLDGAGLVAEVVSCTAHTKPLE